MPLQAYKQTYFYQHRFVFLLCSLLLFILVQPLIKVHVIGVDGGQLVAAAIYISAVLCVAEKLSQVAIAVMISIPALIFGVSDSQSGIAISIFLDICLLAYTGMRLIRYMFSGRKMSENALMSAICLYLMLGIIFAHTFLLLTVLSGKAVVIYKSGVPASTMSELLYFSYVTLTSVGYGDVHPVTPFARSLATIEAITAQLFLAVLVGRFVGIRLPSKSNEDETPA